MTSINSIALMNPVDLPPEMTKELLTIGGFKGDLSKSLEKIADGRLRPRSRIIPCGDSRLSQAQP